ncbi:MAG: LytTR family DNA-binding domain-containing protein [Mucilaginibacter sp.]|jgi:DNA-binding LytR/AlgR family response regulator|uniref:LytR/AlgR family response regulator transcription factor n=1 Tax=Mucilaginibacter sp. TaxID=1882438 RepID=UPI003561B733
MQILVIEDELKTARALIKMISQIRPDSRVDGPLQKVSTSVEYLSAHPAPDLIFMDIQLADGISFEIFQKVKVDSPVIFCTAYDEYALDAFKANGIDYILKPFTEDAFRRAFDKMDRFIGQRTGDISPALIAQILKLQHQDTGKSSFLVYKHGKYLNIPTDDIAYFFVHNEQITIVTFDNETFHINQSLEQITAQLSPLNFFKLNRQYLISFKAIKEVEQYFARKLLVKLVIPSDEKLLVGKDKATSFLAWLDNR